jgi:hypothetical protein
VGTDKCVISLFSMLKGEGAFSMVIKPLDAALIDNDHIYAVVCLFPDRTLLFTDVTLVTGRSLEQQLIVVGQELHYMLRVQLRSNNAF